MSLPTCIVTTTVYLASGNPDLLARLRAKLSTLETDGGFVVPSEVEACADPVTGLISLPVWPNARGTAGSTYSFTLEASERTERLTGVVPAQPTATLQSCVALPAAPALPMGAQAIADALAAGVAANTAATTATTQAGTATTQAGIATTKAGEAAGSAGAAAGSAGVASAKAGAADGSATAAAMSAGAAAGSAGAAEGSATAAATSAGAAAGSAGAASTSAAQASTYAGQALGYRDAAATSKQAASDFAGAASVSAGAAAGSAGAAAGSAGAAAGSAGAAATSAGAASASADTASAIAARFSNLDAAVTGAATSASAASTSAGAAATSATGAATARALAEAARDSVNTTGKVFADTASGIAGVADGQTFAVLDASLQFWIVYKNNAGAALELARNYTKAYIDSIVVRTNYKGWLYVVTDLAGKLGFGLTTAGKFVLGVGGDIVARITSNETEIIAQKAQFVRSARGGVYAWVLLDAAKTKIALAVDKAGNLIAKGRDVLAELDAVKVIANAINASVKSDGNTHASRMAWVDPAGKAPFRATRAGRILVWDRDVLKELDALNSSALGLSVPATARENGTYLAVPFTDKAGKLQIRTIRKSDGLTLAVTSAGNNVGPALTSDNKVLFVSDASGAWVQSYVPASGGSVFPTFSSRDLACWGDSLTAGAGSTGGQTYPVQLLAMLNDGRQAYNGGIGGQTAAQIVARQGGTPSLLTVAGDQIPASGAVNVTVRTVSLITNQGQQSFTGMLAGVAGTLARAADDSYSFTRSLNGVAVACPPGTPFIPDVAVQNRGSTAILIYGRNSFGDGAAATLALIASSINYLSAYYKNVLVGLILNGTTEVIGSATYNSIKAINDAIKAAYPNNYVDTQVPPTVDEMAALGFVPDATDNADIANGCIPTHMRNYAGSDTLHMNSTGYGLWALRFKNSILAKGW